MPVEVCTPEVVKAPRRTSTLTGSSQQVQVGNGTSAASVSQKHARPRRSRRRRLLMGLLASALAIVVTCGAFELVLRIVTDRSDQRQIRFEFWKFMHKDVELGWIPLPNTRVEYARYGASFTTNSLGLRGREYPIARRPGIRRVVVLGDSMAWGHGVSEGRCFAEYLERSLPNTEVINLAVPGFNIRTELRYYQRLGAQFQPDIVVLALCQNDVIDFDRRPSPDGPNARSAADTAVPSASAAQNNAGILRPIKCFLVEHSYLYAACQQAVNGNKTLARTAVRLGLKEDLAGFEMLDDNLHAAIGEYPSTVRRAMEQLSDDILTADAFVGRHGARLLVALIPALQTVEPDELVRSIAYTHYEVDDFDIDKPYRLINEFTAEHHIPTVSPLASFRNEHRRGTALYLPGDLHLSSEGHRLFADALRPVLIALLNGAPAAPRESGRLGP